MKYGWCPQRACSLVGRITVLIRQVSCVKIDANMGQNYTIDVYTLLFQPGYSQRRKAEKRYLLYQISGLTVKLYHIRQGGVNTGMGILTNAIELRNRPRHEWKFSLCQRWMSDPGRKDGSINGRARKRYSWILISWPLQKSNIHG